MGKKSLTEAVEVWEPITRTYPSHGEEIPASQQQSLCRRVQVRAGGVTRLASALGDADDSVASCLQHALDVLEQALLAMQHEGHLWNQARVHNACPAMQASGIRFLKHLMGQSFPLQAKCAACA